MLCITYITEFCYAGGIIWRTTGIAEDTDAGDRTGVTTAGAGGTDPWPSPLLLYLLDWGLLLVSSLLLRGIPMRAAMLELVRSMFLSLGNATTFTRAHLVQLLLALAVLLAMICIGDVE